MSVQPSLNNSNMVVAEIINEINSTQPTRNYPQNARATPIQQQQPTQQMQQPPQQMQRPTQQMQRPAQPQQQQQQPSQKRATPFRRPDAHQPKMSKSTPTQRTPKKSSFLQKQKEKMRNKKVRFKEEVEEHVLQEHDSNSESESDSDDSNILEEVIHKSKKKVSEKPKFLKKDEVKSTDLSETKGFYTKAITFFTNDTKEPLLVLALVFAISMPVVNKLMTRFLPFLMKYGEGSMFVLGIKALIVAVAFFSVKKLLL